MNLDYLTFPVIEVDLEVAMPTEDKGLVIGFELTGLKAIYRENNLEPKEWLGYHTNDYKLITNKEVIESSLEIIEDMGLKIKGQDQRLTWTNDRSMHLALVLDQSFKLDQNDEHDLMLNIYNSYDGSLSYGIDFGTFRLICSNGAHIGTKIANYRKKHFNEFKVEVLRKQITIAVERFPELKQIYENLQETNLTPKDIDKIFETALKRNIIGKKDTEDILNLMPPKLNAYVVMNIFTYYLTHVMQSHQRATSMNQFVMSHLYDKVK